MITSLSLGYRFVTTLTAISIAILPTVSQAAPMGSPYPPGFLRATPPPRERYKEIPIESNARVRRWLHYFVKEDRARFDRFMSRGARYRITVQEILMENGAPPELYYLGMIESGYASQARSIAKAVGIWQFIAPTARRYGLRVDKEVDERLDVLRATKAAARYLNDLEREFGSWYLAMAAYNCGEGRVRRAIRKHHTKDFWTLARRGALPKETIEYVPKFQAAMEIARNPERYGFSEKKHYDFPDMKKVRITRYTSLNDVARRQRVPFASVRAMNPHLLKSRAPSSRRGYDVWVPKIH
ncbi:MAG: lytic transglycosylase domain-containing protein [Bdellovibrionota bacterium]